MAFNPGTLIPITGIVNFILIVFQILSGRRFFKISIQVHRKVGVILLITAAVHGILAIIVS